jgi:GNAT superfamily N-acetyltransferase
MEVTIRPAAPADARGIAEVQVATWRTTYDTIVPRGYLDGLSVDDRERRWAPQLDPAGPAFAFVAVDGAGRVIGFASGGPRRDGDPTYAGELYAIYLLAECQGQGVGSRLVVEVARDLAGRGMPSMLLWVFAANPARRFYEALGGVYLGEQQFEINGAMITEVAYGWRDTTPLWRE